MATKQEMVTGALMSDAMKRCSLASREAFANGDESTLERIAELEFALREIAAPVYRLSPHWSAQEKLEHAEQLIEDLQRVARDAIDGVTEPTTAKDAT